MSNQEGLIYPPGWEQRQGPSEEGIIKELITKLGYNFADIAIKWGARYVDKDYIAIFRSQDWGIGPTIHIEVDARPGRQVVFIRRGSGEGFVSLPNPEEIFIPLKGGDFVETTSSGLQKAVRKEDGFIAWDKELPLEEAVSALEAIDKEAERRGLYNSASHQRKALPEPIYISQQKFKVAEVFKEIGGLRPFFGMSPDEAQSQFDHPEELVVRHDPYTGNATGLAHKRDAEYLDQREKIVNEVLLEKGLTYMELSDGLVKSPDVFEPIAKAVYEEVKKRNENLLRAETLRRAPPREDAGTEATRAFLIAFYEGRADEAKRLFEEAVRNHPESSYVYHDYAVILTRTDGLEAALPYFIKSTEREPKDLTHFLQAAKCLWQLGKEDEAMVYIRKACEFEEVKKIMQEQNLSSKDVIEYLKQNVKNGEFS